jgi:hypothetical protein
LICVVMMVNPFCIAGVSVDGTEGGKGMDSSCF